MSSLVGSALGSAIGSRFSASDEGRLCGLPAEPGRCCHDGVEPQEGGVVELAICRATFSATGLGFEDGTSGDFRGTEAVGSLAMRGMGELPLDALTKDADGESTGGFSVTTEVKGLREDFVDLGEPVGDCFSGDRDRALSRFDVLGESE